MVIDMNYWTKVLKKFLIFIFTVIILYLCFKLAIFYMPFLISFIISLLLEPIIRFLMKKCKTTRKVSSIITISIILLIIIGLLTWGITTIVTEGYGFLENIGTYMNTANELLQKFIDSENFKKINVSENITNIIQNIFSNTLSNVTQEINTVLTGFLNWITQIPTIGVYLMVTFLSLYLICSDKVYILDQVEHHLPEKWSRKLFKHMKEIVKSLGAYLKAELSLVIISFVISVIGLYILKIAGFNIGYPLLYAVGIGFVDALPIFGSRNGNVTMGNNFSI